MGVENVWHSRHSVEMSGSSLFRHFCHVTKSEIGMKSVHRAFMGIKMTAQLIMNTKFHLFPSISVEVSVYLYISNYSTLAEFHTDHVLLEV